MCQSKSSQLLHNCVGTTCPKCKKWGCLVWIVVAVVFLVFVVTASLAAAPKISLDKLWRLVERKEILAGHCIRWFGSRVVSMPDSSTEGPGFKSQPQRCRLTVLGKLFTPIVPLFSKLRNW